jgi:AhpD family alkylhydroperoxidase
VREAAADATVAHAQRFDTRRVAAEAHGAMVALDDTVDLDPQLRELVKIRASMLNGCAFCIQLHTQDALAAGERAERLFALAAWDESPFFTARERAALRFADAVTQLAPGGVSDEVYDEARAHFDEAELAQLLFAVVAINAWNRLAVASRKLTRPAHSA